MWKKTGVGHFLTGKNCVTSVFLNHFHVKLDSLSENMKYTFYLGVDSMVLRRISALLFEKTN
jgi:hypothetical protein